MRLSEQIRGASSREELIVFMNSIAEMDKAEFQAFIIVAIETFDLNPRDMARTFKVSIPTIDRYKRGESAPHPIGRQSMINQLLGMIRHDPH